MTGCSARSPSTRTSVLLKALFAWAATLQIVVRGGDVSYVQPPPLGVFALPTHAHTPQGQFPQVRQGISNPPGSTCQSTAGPGPALSERRAPPRRSQDPRPRWRRAPPPP